MRGPVPRGGFFVCLLVTIWAVSVWLENTSFYPEKLSIKTIKYFYLPPAGRILVKSVFPEFTGVLVSYSKPSWVRALCFGFTWAQTWPLAETSHVRLSNYWVSGSAGSWCVIRIITGPIGLKAICWTVREEDQQWRAVVYIKSQRVSRRATFLKYPVSQ